MVCNGKDSVEKAEISRGWRWDLGLMGALAFESSWLSSSDNRKDRSYEYRSWEEDTHGRNLWVVSPDCFSFFK